MASFMFARSSASRCLVIAALVALALAGLASAQDPGSAEMLSRLQELVESGGGQARAPKNRDLRIMGPQKQSAQASQVQITSAKDATEAAAVPQVLELNTWTFGGNVLSGPESQHASHWVVVFCPNWWEPCQKIAQPFADLATEWQGRLNQDLLKSEVRFAKVDCATDKVLCNEQDVDGYPVLNHYVGGVRVAKFSGGQKNDLERLPKWLNKQLAAAVSDRSGLSAGSVDSVRDVLASYLVPGSRAIDVALALLGLAASFRLVLSNPELWEKGGSASRVGAAGVPTTSAASAGSSSTGSARLRQLLPEQWRADRGSMEL